MKAYKIIAGDNKRPLLVLREFSTFDDPGNEKLSRKLYTEKTVMLSHWFNCIRLPYHVTKEDHPFNGFFEGENPPQLFLASTDGSMVIPFEYKSSRADLVKDMFKILDVYYSKNPVNVVNDLIRMLPQFDKLDWKIQDLKEKLDKAIENDGPNSGKARKLRKELSQAEAERKKLEEKKEALRNIPLNKS